MGSRYEHLSLEERRLIFRLLEAKSWRWVDRQAAGPAPRDDLSGDPAELVR